MAFDGIALDQSAVTGVTAVVMHGIGVEDFAPFTGLINAKAVMMTWNRRKVAGNDNLVARFIPAHKDKYRALMVVHHQPLKTVRIEVKLVQCFMVAVGQVQIADQPLHAVVPVVSALQQMPVEAGIVVPLAPPGELVAHKQQFLPGKANIQP